MVLSAATLAKDTPLSSCVGHPYRKGYTFFLIVSVDTLGKCYMPVCELGSTSFSVVPVTSPSFPSFPSPLCHRRLFILHTVHYRLSSSLRLSSFAYSFVTDLFSPCHVASIISRICGCTILL